jgi:N-acetylmuramoyl-L-alanine amidase
LEKLKKGFTGERVVDIQRRLRLLGYNLGEFEIDGILGPQTINAIKKFQQERGLLSSGMVDEETWQELVDAGYKTGDRFLYLKNPPFRGDDVKMLQFWLKSLGFYLYNENGIFSESTRRALIEFQKNMNIPADGVLGKETLQNLISLKRIINSHKTSNFPQIRQYNDDRTFEKIKVIFDFGENFENGTESTKFYRDKIYICKSIANFCKDILNRQGVESLLTVNENENMSLFLFDRVNYANKSNSDILVSLNLSYSTDEDANGSSCFYFQGVRSYSIPGKNIANLIQDKFVTDLNILDCRVHGANYAILKETTMTSILVEPAFISNKNDRLNLKNTEYQMGISKCITEAITSYLNE